MKIISGGQTGVDRAAFDFALAKGIPHGGFVPRNRRAADGVLDPRYTVVEIASDDVKDRTHLNVELADLTLIFTSGKPTGGTEATLSHARNILQPPERVLHIDFAAAGLSEDASVDAAIHDWLKAQTPWATLNIAGPRAEEQPAIYLKTLSTLLRLSAKGILPDFTARETADRSFDQFMNNFRHWDVIRWTVSMGLFAFIATAVAAVVAANLDATVRLTVWAWTAFALSGICLLWTYLLIRLWRYHNIAWERTMRLVNGAYDPRTAMRLCETLPFKLNWSTASALFILIFAVLAIAGFDVGIWCLARQT
ncbi:putative molybdenum carrier protein [Sphingomonas sp. Leaf25]|uniref:putative molybdenum carrier protein n=1 Tax=Sphingomonas sp. Leaf25 TaxID=1735692 RepID=UPI0009EB756D|nr:putative molybdenum carrier protein [Sphingomonas sp. Leaf25]